MTRARTPRRDDPPPPEPPGRWDTALARGARIAGLTVGVIEVAGSRLAGAPVDPNVLLFSAMLLGLPLALGGGRSRDG